MNKNTVTEKYNIFSNGLIWNAVGGTLFAGQSVVVLYLCTRFYDHETAGVVSISYAVAMLAYMIALYGVRNYQVTDSNENYKFADYLGLRIVSIVTALVLVLSYMVLMYNINNYTFHKCATVTSMTILKMVNAFEDALIGRLQQRGFFAFGARMGAIRELITLVTVVLLICFRLDLVIVLLGGTIVGIISEVLLGRGIWSYLEIEKINSSGYSFDRIKGIAKECFPLCISAVLAIYMSNIPKYLTDWYLDELTQAVVGYLILPAFTIALLNQFIYTPFIKNLGDQWNSGDKKAFIRMILIQSAAIILSTVLILLISLWIGIPILSYIFNIDLKPYITSYIMMLTGGGLYALEYYLIIPMTVIHEQKRIAYGYAISIFLSLLIQKYMVVKYGLDGVGIVYIFVNLFNTIYLSCLLLIKYRSKA